MKELVYATTNKEKVLILQKYLASVGVKVIQEAVELNEPRADDVTTIAVAKAQEAFAIIKKPLVVLDAGFYIEALGGFPGAYMNMAMKKIGVDGILRLLAGYDRSCTFRKCLAYIDGERQVPHVFLSEAKGVLAETARGSESEPAPFNRLFIPAGEELALTEWPLEKQYSWYAQLSLRDAGGLEFRDWIQVQ